MPRERQQDGWLVTIRDTECFWASDLGRALFRGLEEVQAWDESEEPVDLGEPAGSFRISRAYRVDFRPAARLAADHAMEALSDGTFDTHFVEDHDLFARMERELACAFAAQIERVCGPWYEVLGTDEVEVLVDRVGEDEERADYVIAGVWQGPRLLPPGESASALLAEVRAVLDGGDDAG
jgi:hypothetical protein